MKDLAKVQKTLSDVFDYLNNKNDNEVSKRLLTEVGDAHRIVENLVITVVVHTLKDCLIAKHPVEYKKQKYYLTALEIMNSGEEICELMNIDTYDVISDVNGKEVKIF